MTFPFENLEVYKKSLLFVDQVDSLIGIIPDRMHRVVFDQISRAALSIALNIAQANGRWRSGDIKQFFWLARGAAFECVALLEILRSRGLITDKDAQLEKKRLAELANMLHGQINSMEQSERDKYFNLTANKTTLL